MYLEHAFARGKANNTHAGSTNNTVYSASLVYRTGPFPPKRSNAPQGFQEQPSASCFPVPFQTQLKRAQLVVNFTFS